MKLMTGKQFCEFQEKNGFSIEEMAAGLFLSKESVYKRRTGKIEVTLRDVALMSQMQNRKAGKPVNKQTA